MGGSKARKFKSAGGGRGRGVGAHADPNAGQEEDLSWLQLEGDTPTQHQLHRLYRLNKVCKKVDGRHATGDCRDTPQCLKGIRKMKSEKAIKEFVRAVIGDDPNAVAADEELAAPCGLKNLSNTCYLNSALQALFACVPLRAAVYATVSALKPDTPGKAEIRALCDVFARMEMRKSAVTSPKRLVKALGVDPAIQQDAHEFFGLFLSLLEDQHPIMKDCIRSQMRGCHLVCRVCGKCNAETKVADTFLHLTLPVRKSLDLSLTQFFAEEEILEEVGWKCEKCDVAVPGKAKTVLRAPPNTLFVQLLRFEFDMKTLRRKKVRDSMLFPTKLDLAPFAATLGEDAPPAAGDFEYELTSVVNHLGKEPTHGHYTAHAKQPDGTWYCLDDDEAKLTKKYDGEKDVASAEAYMLVYTRKNAKEVDERPPTIPESVADEINAEVANRAADAERWSVQNDKLSATMEKWSELAAQVVTPAEEDAEAVFFVPRRWATYFLRGGICDPPEDGDVAEMSTSEIDETEPDVQILGEAAASATTRHKHERVSVSVANKGLLCAHGKLDPLADYKVVSAEAWLAIVETYGCDMELNSSTALCSECAVDVIKDKQQSTEEDNRTKQMKALCSEHVAQQPDGFFVTAEFLDRWKKKGTSDADVAGLDLTGPLLCTHGNLSPAVVKRPVLAEVWEYLTKEKKFLATTTIPTVAEVCAQCIANDQTMAAQLHAQTQRKFQEKRDLRSIAPVSGKVPSESNRASFARNLKDAVTQHTKDWETRLERRRFLRREQLRRRKEARANGVDTPDGEAGSSTPKRGRTPTAPEPPAIPLSKHQMRKQEEALAQEKRLQDELDELPEEEEPWEKECPVRRVEHPMIPMSWARQWGAWVNEPKNSIALDAPPRIDTSHLFCEHKKFLWKLDELNPVKQHTCRPKNYPIPAIPAVVVSLKELAFLKAEYGIDGVLPCIVEENEQRLLQPEACLLCAPKRLEAEIDATKHFRQATLRVHGKLKKTRRITSVDVDVTVDFSTTVQEVLEQLVVGILEAEDVIVDPAKMTLKKFSAKEDLSPCLTLLECGILPNDALQVQIEECRKAGTESPKPPRSPKPEPVAFDGSNLVGRALETESEASCSQSVWSCPACTYDNEVKRKVCEICGTKRVKK